MFRKKGIEVLLLSDRVDEWMLSFLTEFDGTPLVSVSRGSLDLGKLADEEERKQTEAVAGEFKELTERIAKSLGDRVKEVRVTDRLTDSASCLVSAEGDISGTLERLLKQAGQQAPERKPILEINPQHPLVKQLRTENERAVRRLVEPAVRPGVARRGRQARGSVGVRQADERPAAGPGDGVALGVDPQPAITFSEQDGIRFLHFGSRWVQGAMRLSDPVSLELAYVKDMMAWLLFLEPPPRILQLGLGAGSLTKFCHRHCRGSEITVVEMSRVVIEAAHRGSSCRSPTHRLDIVRADAGDLRGPAAGEGPLRRRAGRPLRPGRGGPGAGQRGVLRPLPCGAGGAGRHGREPVRPARLLQAQPASASARVFDQVITLAPRDEGNLVVLALKGPPLRVDRRALFERADLVKARYGLPARGWAKTIRASLASAA